MDADGVRDPDGGCRRLRSWHPAYCPGLHVVAEKAVDVVPELLDENDFGKMLYLPFSKVRLLLLQTELTVTVSLVLL